MEIEKENKRLKFVILEIRHLLREHILIVNNRPVKNTSKKACYKMLEMLQDFFNQIFME